ncbi:MAG: OmpP1/FadL family transporter [Aestuariibaculum sp.]
MKKIQLLFMGMLCASGIYAQDLTDGIRYSQDEIQGTARFRALSGAFGALGGDLSAISINPASSAIFSKSNIAFTLSNTYTKNNARYFGNSNNTKESDFNFNQAGAAFVFETKSGSPWRKIALGIAYERTRSHDNFWRSIGTNTNSSDIFNDNFTDIDGNRIYSPKNSVSGYFYEHAQGVSLENIRLREGESITEAYADIGRAYGFSEQQAFLGLYSELIDPVSDTNNNTDYITSIAPGNFNHTYSYYESGYNGKVAFNFATQYEDKISLGLNLNSHFVDYEKSTVLRETNSNTGSIVTDLTFENNLRTKGNGFSFQLGGIFKLTQELRLGLSYDSPIWYTLEDETTQFLDTSELINNDKDALNPNIINIFPRYNLRTPGKFTGSLAYVFGKYGLISFDYSFKDYSNIKFKPQNEFTDINNAANDVLTTASTYRIGTEIKATEQLSLRGGFRYEDSPYKNGETVGDLNGYSLGLGYSFGNTRLDFTFDQSQRSSNNNLYNLMSGDSPYTKVKAKNTNFLLSLSFNI